MAKTKILPPDEAAVAVQNPTNPVIAAVPQETIAAQEPSFLSQVGSGVSDFFSNPIVQGIGAGLGGLALGLGGQQEAAFKIAEGIQKREAKKKQAAFITQAFPEMFKGFTPEQRKDFEESGIDLDEYSKLASLNAKAGQTTLSRSAAIPLIKSYEKFIGKAAASEAIDSLIQGADPKQTLEAVKDRSTLAFQESQENRRNTGQALTSKRLEMLERQLDAAKTKEERINIYATQVSPDLPDETRRQFEALMSIDPKAGMKYAQENMPSGAYKLVQKAWAWATGGTSAQQAPQQGQVETKVINGVTYNKVPGGWQKVK